MMANLEDFIKPIIKMSLPSNVIKSGYSRVVPSSYGRAFEEGQFNRVVFNEPTYTTFCNAAKPTSLSILTSSSLPEPTSVGLSP
jgi:hypothetical protein